MTVKIPKKHRFANKYTGKHTKNKSISYTNSDEILNDLMQRKIIPMKSRINL